MTTAAAADPVQCPPLREIEVRFYNDEGYLYIPGVLDAETVEAMRREIFDIMAVYGMTYERLCKASTSSDKLRPSTQYLAGSKLDQYIHSERMRQLVSALLGGDSSLYYAFSAVKAGGGGGTFHFHQDNQYTRHDGPSINMWLALSPMSLDNGCLCVVPRSHLDGTLESKPSGDGDQHKRTAIDPDNYLPVRMNPGDVIAFSRLTVHGSGPNNTNEPRMAYAMQFHRDDVNEWRDDHWSLLKQRPRFDTGPVDEITPGRADRGE
jgi:2-oxoglutarate-dependent dioxygenase